MKFLSSENLKKVFAIVKGWIDALETKVTTAIDTKIAAQKFKTVNGEAITGTGDISIDLSLFKVVSALPTSGIDANKIYLVAKEGAPEGNIYTEYMYVNGKWEKIGEFSAAVDLTPYAKTADMNTALAAKADSATMTTELGKKADKTTMTTELGKKANSNDVYPKTQTYSKTEVDTALAGKLAESDMVALTDAEIEALATEALG
mgnify:CR=1 FL=1